MRNYYTRNVITMGNNLIFFYCLDPRRGCLSISSVEHEGGKQEARFLDAKTAKYGACPSLQV